MVSPGCGAITATRVGFVCGFTIIELMVVLVIMVAATALVGPDFVRGLDAIELRSATRDVRSALRQARSRAILSASEATFQINLDKRIYQISGKPKVYHLPDSIQYKLVTAESEMTGDNSGMIRFFPDGSSTGGRVTMVMGRRKRVVDVNWMTGQLNSWAEDEQ